MGKEGIEGKWCRGYRGEYVVGGMDGGREVHFEDETAIN